MSFISAALGGSALASAGSSLLASNKQADAAGKAGQLAAANQATNNKLLTGVNDQNQNMLAQQGQTGLDQIGQGYAAAAPFYAGAQDFLNQGYQQARSDLNSQTEAGIRDVNNTYEGGRNALAQGFDNARGAIQPYADAGGAALAQERNMLGIGDPNYSFQAADPSYQWRLDQGLGATNAQAAASGLNGSGARLIALNNYAQGAASQEYGAQFGRVAGLAGQGQQAAGDIANLYSGQGNALNNSLMQQGNTLLGARSGLGAGLAGQAYQWGTGSAGIQGQQAGNQIQRGNQLAGYGLDVTGQQVGANNNYVNALVGNNNAGTQARGQAYQDQGAATASGYAGVGKAVSNGLGSYAAYSTYGQPAGANYNGLVYGAAPQSASSIKWL